MEKGGWREGRESPTEVKRRAGRCEAGGNNPSRKPTLSPEEAWGAGMGGRGNRGGGAERTNASVKETNYSGGTRTGAVERVTEGQKGGEKHENPRRTMRN